MNELEKAILRTIVYFDIFDYPLALVEVWKWLNKPDRAYLLNEVQEALDNFQAKIEIRNGFYFLIGRSELVAKRLLRYNLAEAKFKRALRFIKWLRFIPFIKMIAVCNSLAYSNASKEGDIDLFIVADKNRLWLSRFLAVGFLKLLRVRPTLVSKQDTIDANFFLSAEDLNISSSQISDNDLYLNYWIDQLVPIFDPENIYQKFQTANSWVKQILPNAFGYDTAARRRIGNNFLSKIVRFKLEWILGYNFFEKLAKKFQLKILPQDLRAMINQNTKVIVNEQMLKFHREDRREEYLRKFNEKVSYEIS